MLTLDVELYMFTVMVATGAVLGFCTDLYRAARSAWGMRGLAGLLHDVAFAVTCTVVVTAGLVLGSWGAFRLAVFAGAATGLGLYAWLASPVVHPAALGAFAALKRLAGAVRARLRPLAERAAGLAGGLRSLVGAAAARLRQPARGDRPLLRLPRFPRPPWLPPRRRTS